MHKTLKLLILLSLMTFGRFDSVIAQLLPDDQLLQKIIDAPKFTTKFSEVERGEGLYQALKRISIENELALKIINTLRDEVEFSKLKVGDKLEGTFNNENELISFAFIQNPVEIHTATFDKEKNEWVYRLKEHKTFWQPRMLVGELKADSTLIEDLLDHGLSKAVANDIINVLLCKVNFRMNAREGDQFKVLLNERKFRGLTVQSKILFTSYEGVRAGHHESFYYEDEEKSSTYSAHYTKDGQALIRSGLRYPLSSLHVRSGYGWRRHPVTGRKAMHRGVDLRARSGRPVHAVAAGKVVLSTFNKYAGNKIGIKHRDGSTSYYYHLSRRLVKVGNWVRSYQVIGKVGATGRVTGPHLHFGFKQPNGRWMNPLNKRMIATPKLSGARYVSLQEQIEQTENLIVDLEISKEAKYLVANYPGHRQQFDFTIFSFE